jgi:hypothetical protein
MSYRDILYSKKSNFNMSNSRYFSNNSLDVSKRYLNKFYQRQRLLKDTSKQNLVEVIPCIRGQNTLDLIEYTKIKDFLNIKTLREIAKHVCLLPVEINENADYFSYQYPKQERIYISKKTWRVYAESNNFNTQYQAFMLLRFLAKFGYVEGYRRIQRRKSYSFQNNIMNKRR